MFIVLLLIIAALSTVSLRIDPTYLAISGGAKDTVVESNEAFKEIGDFLLRVAAMSEEKQKRENKGETVGLVTTCGRNTKNDTFYGP